MLDKLERGISANSSVLKCISHDSQLMKPPLGSSGVVEDDMVALVPFGVTLGHH